MKTQVEGIVLRYFKYGDSSIIAHLYTLEYGRQSFLFKGSRSRKAKRKMNFLQPLHFVSLPMEYRPQKELYTAHGAQANYTFRTIPFMQVKNSIAFFIAELLAKILQAQEADIPLFSFLKKAFLFLDEEQTKGANFHLTFLIKLTSYIGIQPTDNYTESHCYLSVLSGEYTDVEQQDCFNKEESTLWNKMFLFDWEETEQIALSQRQRNNLLKSVLRYYNYHIHELGQLKSLRVLQELFQD